jgi:hypothetical protein
VLILQPVPTPNFVGRPIKMTLPAPKQRSLSELEANAVKSRVVAALREISRRLQVAGVRHGVVGALAVGIHGWPRATSDVDLLLAPEAWLEARDGTLAPRVDLPEQIDGVAIDYLPISVAGDFLIESFDRVLVTEGVPIAPVEVVILTKLVRLAMRDQADIVELLKAAVFDADSVEGYLELHAPMLTPRFRELREQAQRELERGD